MLGVSCASSWVLFTRLYRLYPEDGDSRHKTGKIDRYRDARSTECKKKNYSAFLGTFRIL